MEAKSQLNILSTFSWIFFDILWFAQAISDINFSVIAKNLNMLFISEIDTKLIFRVRQNFQSFTEFPGAILIN